MLVCIYFLPFKNKKHFRFAKYNRANVFLRGLEELAETVSLNLVTSGIKGFQKRHPVSFLASLSWKDNQGGFISLTAKEEAESRHLLSAFFPPPYYS